MRERVYVYMYVWVCVCVIHFYLITLRPSAMLHVVAIASTPYCNLRIGHRLSGRLLQSSLRDGDYTRRPRSMIDIVAPC